MCLRTSAAWRTTPTSHRIGHAVLVVEMTATWRLGPVPSRPVRRQLRRTSSRPCGRMPVGRVVAGRPLDVLQRGGRRRVSPLAPEIPRTGRRNRSRPDRQQKKRESPLRPMAPRSSRRSDGVRARSGCTMRAASGCSRRRGLAVQSELYSADDARVYCLQRRTGSRALSS